MASQAVRDDEQKLENDASDASAANKDEVLPPLFWTSGDDGNADDWMDETSPEFEALKAIVRESQTPQTPRERAEQAKEKGNASIKYKANKMYVRYAVEHYTTGILCGYEDDRGLMSALYSNRAYAALLLKNYRKAYEDGLKAVEYDGGNVKGWFRAAKGALALEKAEECARCCVGGLEIEGDNRDLKVMLREAKRLVEKREKQAKLDAEEKTRIQAYVEALKMKQVRLGPATFQTGERMPTIASTSTPESTKFNYWTLFVYPESMQTDMVEAMHEDDELGAHLDVLFDPNGQPLQWDSKNQYTRDTVELYWQTNASTPYTWEQVETKLLDAAGVTRREADDDTRREIVAAEKTKVDPRDQFMRVIDPKTKLGDLLREEEFVMAGHPVFYVVAKGTEFRQQFLNGEWEL